MEITVLLNKKDLAGFNRYYFVKYGLMKRIYFVVIVAFLIPFLLNRDKPFSLLVYFSTVVVAGGVFGIIYLGSLYFSMSRLMKSQSGKGSAPQQQKFSVKEEGLLEVTAAGRKLQPWKDIKSIEADRNSVYIFTDSTNTHILPKRSFNDVNTLREFVSLVETKIKNSRQGTAKSKV